MIHAYAAKTAGGTLEPFDYDPGALKDKEVEIKVEYCGIGYSDLSSCLNAAIYGCRLFLVFKSRTSRGRIK